MTYKHNACGLEQILLITFDPEDLDMVEEEIQIILVA